MIELLEDLEKRLLRERSAQAAREFLGSVRPLYRNSVVQPKPEHIGSCILLDIDGQPVLSTAAHVLDNITTGWSLYVGGPVGTRPVLVHGGVRRTTAKPKGNRDLDRLDCGFWQMPQEVVRELGEVTFLDASRLSRNRAPTNGRYYMAMGYRLSRQKGAIDYKSRTISNRASRYSGTVGEIPALAAKLGRSGAEHMFLHFPKYAQDEAGRRRTAYNPVGFSGGALIDLGDFTSAEAYAPGRPCPATLSGMLIEHHAEHHAMVAVKVGLILEGIRRSIA